MAVDANALIRAGSGVVFVAVGLLAWWATRGSPRRGGGALATFCVTFGAAFVAVNFLGYDPRTGVLGLTIETSLWAVATAALVMLAWHGPWTTRVGRREVKVGLALALAYAILLDVLIFPWADGVVAGQGFAVPPGGVGRALILGFGPMFAALSLVTVLAAREAARSADAGLRTGLALLSVGLFAFAAHTIGAAGAAIGVFGGGAFAAMCLATAIAVAVPWLAVGGGGRYVAWTILAITAYGEAEALFGLSSGSVGIIRTLAAAVIAVAVLRGGLFGTMRPAQSVGRGGLAAGALATLFIVAQVAQNFFSAEYGLLTGGIMAGAFVFAASPIQRTFERMSSRELVAPPIPASNKSKVAGPRQEAAFRDAVKLALRDRRFDDQEELALMRLADVIGLPAERAAAIRQEVQKANGVR